MNIKLIWGIGNLLTASTTHPKMKIEEASGHIHNRFPKASPLNNKS